MKDLLDQINYLANKKKTVGLTEDEAKLQNELRQEYLRIFREGFISQLSSVKVVDEYGNDVTPNKLKSLKKAKKLSN